MDPQQKKAFPTKLVIVIIVLLFIIGTFLVILFTGAATYKAVDPTNFLTEAYNSVRTRDVKDIVDYIKAYVADNNNDISLLGSIASCSGTPMKIGTGSSMLNLDLKMKPIYYDKLPKDPQLTDTEDQSGYIGYTICKLTDTTIRVDAPKATGKTISAQ